MYTMEQVVAFCFDKNEQKMKREEIFLFLAGIACRVATRQYVNVRVLLRAYVSVTILRKTRTVLEEAVRDYRFVVE